MKWIDLHCDTLSILTGGADTGIKRGRAGLRENNLCVDARRLKEAGAAAQFAVLWWYIILFNLIKGVAVSLVTVLLYKRISWLLNKF